MPDQPQSDNGSTLSQPQEPLPAEQTIDQVPERADGDDVSQPASGDSGPPLPAEGSVLQALSASLPSVPRIRLQDPEDEPPTSINRLSSEQMPGTAELPGRYHLVGEIARGGMGAVFKGRDTDPGRDIYSLGALAYFLLTGQAPFAGRSMIQMLLAHISEPPRPLTEHRSDIPADLEALVLRRLAKASTDRFADVLSLDSALAGCAAAGAWSEAEAGAWWRARVDRPTQPLAAVTVDR
jgi:hypothetical protein